MYTTLHLCGRGDAGGKQPAEDKSVVANEVDLDDGHETRRSSCPPQPSDAFRSIDGNTCPAGVAIHGVTLKRARRSSALRRPRQPESRAPISSGTCLLIALSEAGQASRLSPPYRWNTEWPRSEEEYFKVLDVALRRWRRPWFGGAVWREYEYLELTACPSMAVALPERGRGEEPSRESERSSCRPAW
jgi:hypothetical protein